MHMFNVSPLYRKSIKFSDFIWDFGKLPFPCFTFEKIFHENLENKY